MASRYHEVYDRWRTAPEAFWAEAAREIDWITAPQTIFDPGADVYGRWFPDATCNTCYNALDRHADGGRGEQTALIYDSPLFYHKVPGDLTEEVRIRGNQTQSTGTSSASV